MARERGVTTTHEGMDGLRKLPIYVEIGIVFDATSAYAHKEHDAALQRDGKLVVDLTPAALGPFFVPLVGNVLDSTVRNVNMVTCRGQETIPTVPAVSRVGPGHYPDIIPSVSSTSSARDTRRTDTTERRC